MSVADVLVVSVSARWLAASAARCGLRVVAADAFADVDVPIGVRFLPPVRRATAGALARAAEGVSARAVAWGAPFENDPRSLARLARGRELVGTSPEAVRKVRDPVRVAEALRRAGVAAAITLPPGRAEGADPGRRWLRRPRRGGGGFGISPWSPGEPLYPGEALQERVAGRPGSALALGDGRRAALLGLTRILLAPAPGAPFRYGGNLYPWRGRGEGAVAESAARAAASLVAAFGLLGLFGIDFVASGGRLTVTEVNPRPTAGMELLELPDGPALFALHAEASRGRLPGALPPPPREVRGKRVVYAPRDAVAGETASWRALGARDVPRPGTPIRRGSPLCTVLARGADARACRRALARRARRFQRLAAAWAVDPGLERAPAGAG